EQAGFWESMLAKAGALLPDSMFDGSDTVATARELIVTIPADVSTGVLNVVAPAFHARPDEILLAALSVAVEAWRRRRGRREQSGIVVDVEGHGRDALDGDLDLSRTVGWFTTLHPVWLRAPDVDVDDALAGGAAIGRAIKRIKEQLRRV